MQIGFDAKRYFHNHTGLGNYARTLVDGLKKNFSECQYRLYDEKTLRRTFSQGALAQREGCDLYHGLSNEIPLDSVKIGIPTLVTIHDVAWRTFPDMYHRIDRMLYDWKYGWAARHATRVVAISESTKRDVQRFYGVPDERISVVYQPVQELFYTPMDEALAWETASSSIPGLPRDFLLSVGSVNSRKNLMAVLQAMSLIPAENRMPLVVVGSGREYMEKCRSFAEQHLRKGDVRWLSQLNDSKRLQALYTCARVMVYPSFYEGFGLPVVEAALQGTPVLTSTISSLPEAAGPDACLVDPHAKDAPLQMAEHLNTLCSDRTKAEQIGKAMQTYARNTFAPDILMKQMMDLYLEMA